MLKYISKGWMKSLIFSNPGGGATRLIFEWGVRLGNGTITVAMAMTKYVKNIPKAMTTIVKNPYVQKKCKKRCRLLHMTTICENYTLGYTLWH